MDCHKYIVTTYQMLMSLMSFFFNTFQLHVCFCVSQGPEVGCVEGDSCHTGLQRHPGLCPSDQCCRLRDSCRAHSEPLEKDTNTDKNAFPVAFTRLLHVKATLPTNTLSLFLDRAYPLWKLNWIKNKIKIKPNEKYKAIANLVTEQLLPSPSMSMLQASPSPLSSVSVCSGLLSNGQLSQRSPTPSLSESNCRGLYTDGQLSYAKHTHSCIHTHRGCEYLPVFRHCILKVTPCLSHSLTLSSMMSSLSSSGSQASPSPSRSRSSCPEFGSLGQLSCSQSHLRLMKSHSTWTLPANQIRIFLFLYLLTVIGCVLLAG